MIFSFCTSYHFRASHYSEFHLNVDNIISSRYSIIFCCCIFHNSYQASSNRFKMVLLRFQMFSVIMELKQKKMAFILVSLIGGYMIFAMRLNSPQVYSNIKPKPSSRLLEDTNELLDMRKRANRGLFVSRNNLSFCKQKEAKGDIK